MRDGFDSFGNQFTIRDEPPYLAQWRGMRGSAVEKLAKFDQELARQLAQRKITLPKAKMILLQRDVEAAAERAICRLVASEAPYLCIVLRFTPPCGLCGQLLLKCTCGAMRERLSYFAGANTYPVLCPRCRTGFRFEDVSGNGFVFMASEVSVYRDMLERQSDIPIRELARSTVEGAKEKR